MARPVLGPLGTCAGEREAEEDPYGSQGSRQPPSFLPTTLPDPLCLIPPEGGSEISGENDQGKTHSYITTPPPYSLSREEMMFPCILNIRPLPASAEAQWNNARS